MIDISILAPGCTCATCCVIDRSVTAQAGFYATEVSDTDYMLTWLGEFDITGVDWGQTYTGTFNTSSSTSPDSTGTSTCLGYGCAPQNSLYEAYSDSGSSPCSRVLGYTYYPSFTRTQFYLPFPVGYFVAAIGMNLSAGSTGCPSFPNWGSMICSSPAGSDSDYPMIVDIGVPAADLDTTIAVQNYIFGILTSNSDASGTQLTCPTIEGGYTDIFAFPTLADAMASGTNMCSFWDIVGFGADWTGETDCYASGDDPFTGVSDWP